MSVIYHQLRCRWHECPSTGPYADAKILFEHLVNAHSPSAGRSLFCIWDGCLRRAPARGPKQQCAHFQGIPAPFALLHVLHAGYHPDECALPACGTAQDLQLQAHPAPGLRCRWAGGGRAFPEDAGGAALLAAHLSAEHGAAPCKWAGCVRQPRGSFKTHVLSHLPEWYGPFQCSECGKAYQKRNALTRHTNAAIWRNGCRKRRAQPAAGSSKRRKLDDREGHEAGLLAPSSPPSIGSSPLTSPTFSPPPPPESSSPPSSQPPVSSSPPPEQQVVAVGDPILDITNEALHLRLFSAEKLICEMQVEMDALRRAVQNSLEFTPPSERDDDFDWSLDD